jgi:pSer/pThr/pTyr-binding forkhead associated (FHA) protein
MTDNNGRLRCWIRVGSREYELRPGQTVVGRHDSCHIALDDALASRRHALLHLDAEKLTVEDLGSVNGVLINGKRIRKSDRLVDGDELKLGNQLLHVHMGTRSRPSRHRVGATTLARLPDQLVASDDELTIVRDEEMLNVLAGAGAKALRMGKGEEAEAIQSKSLLTIRDHVKSGRKVDLDAVELAACQGLRLAIATKKRFWLEYSVELYASQKRIMRSPVVELMYESVRQVSEFDLDILRSYVASLSEQQPSMTPAERFLVRRIEGLIASLS